MAIVTILVIKTNMAIVIILDIKTKIHDYGYRPSYQNQHDYCDRTGHLNQISIAKNLFQDRFFGSSHQNRSCQDCYLFFKMSFLGSRYLVV